MSATTEAGDQHRFKAGPTSRVCFWFHCLRSGLSSSAVGTIAGEVVTQGFVGFRIPVWFRQLDLLLVLNRRIPRPALPPPDSARRLGNTLAKKALEPANR